MIGGEDYLIKERNVPECTADFEANLQKLSKENRGGSDGEER
ncbi:MAG: hypothetical protein QOD67_2019 [Caballeronia sp.]|jgi:hypothetical protein|nr:hypothetical protein [Caballeronia sp.]